MSVQMDNDSIPRGYNLPDDWRWAAFSERFDEIRDDERTKTMTYRFGAYTLTTEHPASHYGIPVLLGTNPEGPFGPADNIVSQAYRDLFGEEYRSAGEMVARNVSHNRVPADVIDAARRYCSQWPDGPQVDTERIAEILDAEAEIHQSGCVCADCSDADLTAEND